MNERIRELAKQAGLKKEHGSDREYIGDFDWREFAELIVRECAEVADNADTFRQKWEGIGKYVKEHFGIEK